MINTLRTTLWLFFLCLSYTAISAARTDTTKRSFTANGTGVFSNDGFFGYFKEASVRFKQDSLEKGARLLYTAIQGAEKKANIKRSYPYFVLEFCDIIGEVNNNRLSVDEKRLGLVFLKTLILNPGIDPTVKALAADFKHAPATVFTARLHILLMMTTDPDKANKEADGLLKTHPDLLSINLLKAENCYELGQYDKAIGYADKVISHAPDYAHAYTVRGKAFAEKEDYEKAIADFDQSIKYFPNEETAHYEKGSALISLDKYREAIEPLMFVARKKVNHSSAVYDLARCYKGLGMTDSAMYYINIHIRLHPDDAYGYNLKGLIFYNKRDYPAAVELFTHAISIKNDYSSFYENRGDAYFYNEKYMQAIIDFKKSLSIDKSSAYANDQLGDCYYELNNDKTAIAYHKKALEVDPAYQYAFVGLNRSYTRMGDYNTAINAAKSALKIDSTYSSALGNLGWTYYLAGDMDNCITYSYKALKQDDSATYAMFNIGLATLCKGDFAKAKDLYQSFVKLFKEKDYKIESGAAQDLRDLIKKKKFVTEATFILENILNEKP